MFTDEPDRPDSARLRFLRWLAERDLLEHRAEGIPSGAYAAEEPPPDRPAAEAARRPAGAAKTARTRRRRERRGTVRQLD